MGNLLAKVVEGTKFFASAGVGSSCAIMDVFTIIMELKTEDTRLIINKDRNCLIRQFLVSTY